MRSLTLSSLSQPTGFPLAISTPGFQLWIRESKEGRQHRAESSAAPHGAAYLDTRVPAGAEMGHDEVHSGVDSFHQPWEEEVDVIGPFSRLQPTQWRRSPWWGRGSCPTLTPVPPIVSPCPSTHGDCSLQRALPSDLYISLATRYSSFSFAKLLPFAHTYAWLFYQHLPKITHRSLTGH